MAWQQSAQPNLNYNGTIGLCLQYVQNAFNTGWAGTDAWQAWNTKLQRKHADRNLPAGVYFPVWFDGYWNGLRLGHVGIYKDGRVWCSPWDKARGHSVLNSIAEVERIYGMRYVGWSEDLGGKIIIQGGVMPIAEGQINDDDDIAELWRGFFFRDPTAKEIKDNQGLIGKYWSDASRFLRQTEAFKSVKAQYESAPKLQAQVLALDIENKMLKEGKGSILKKGLYIVE